MTQEFRTFKHQGGLTPEATIGYLLSITNELSKKPDENRKKDLTSDLKRLSYIVSILF
jgi:hypothetical protein